MHDSFCLPPRTQAVKLKFHRQQKREWKSRLSGEDAAEEKKGGLPNQETHRHASPRGKQAKSWHREASTAQRRISKAMWVTVETRVRRFAIEPRLRANKCERKPRAESNTESGIHHHGTHTSIKATATQWEGKTIRTKSTKNKGPPAYKNKCKVLP